MALSEVTMILLVVMRLNLGKNLGFKNSANTDEQGCLKFI